MSGFALAAMGFGLYVAYGGAYTLLFSSTPWGWKWLLV